MVRRGKDWSQVTVQNWYFLSRARDTALCPWNLKDDHEKQQGTSSMLFQALCIIA